MTITFERFHKPTEHLSVRYVVDGLACQVQFTAHRRVPLVSGLRHGRPKSFDATRHVLQLLERGRELRDVANLAWVFDLRYSSQHALVETEANCPAELPY